MSETPVPQISVFRVSPDEKLALAAMTDPYRVHGLLCKAFADPRGARILFRYDPESAEEGWLYVQSIAVPDWTQVVAILKRPVRGPVPVNVALIEPGARLRFRLLAKPSKRDGNKASRTHGQRLTLRTETDQRAWLERQGEAHGFTVGDVRVTGREWNDTKRPVPGKRMHPAASANAAAGPADKKSLHAVQFDGVLTVTDAVRLHAAVAQGIGPQKAFGFGLLSLAHAGG